MVSVSAAGHGDVSVIDESKKKLKLEWPTFAAQFFNMIILLFDCLL
jgi:hypothetical protein